MSQQHFTSSTLQTLERTFRANLVNSNGLSADVASVDCAEPAAQRVQ